MKILRYIIPTVITLWVTFSYAYTYMEYLWNYTRYKKESIQKDTVRSEQEGIFKIVIIPNDERMKAKIDEFYKKLQDQHESFDHIVFISPDIQEWSEIDLDKTTEKRVSENIKQISWFFPKSLVTPLILERKLTVWIAEKEIAHALAARTNKRILIIASVNFSKNVREEIAKLHDQKSIDTLNFGNFEDIDSLEVECRNCLATLKILALEKWKERFHLIDRTSVDILNWSDSDIENTSFIFWEFIDEKKREDVEKSESIEISEKDTASGSGVFLFMGDSHWARGFPYYEKKIERYKEKVTQIFYEKYDINNDLTSKYHRLLSWFDEVVVNLEAGIAEPGSCKKSWKTTQMWMDPDLFPWFRALGITMANIANNHSHDCGNKLFFENKDQFLSGWINPFWYDEIAFRKIRGNTFAFIGIDTIETKPDIEKIQKNIENLTASGNLVIVNIHWWVEYSSGHTEKQKEIGQKLIDSWARLIIGHHPHVVADREIYKWVPIYYSLGNFLFDQPFPETLRWFMVGCEVSKNATSCSDISIYRDSKDYSLHF